MKVELIHWEEEKKMFSAPEEAENTNVDLVLYFGDFESLSNTPPYEELRRYYPNAQIAGCSTAGQIYHDDSVDAEIVAIAMEFSDTEIRISNVQNATTKQSLNMGHVLGAELKAEDLSGVMLLSDGINVNGTELVKGISNALGADIPVVGGLAGDGARFTETVTGINDQLCSNSVVAIGFYGNSIRFGHGTGSGFKPFGPKRKITKSKNNILYELDGDPALDLYKRYLGDEAEALPGSALHFPLLVWDPANPTDSVVRTVLSVDDDANTMTFAGKIPEGYSAQLMRSTLEHLVTGAASAAQLALDSNKSAELALLVSCVGRRLVMGQRYEAEIDAVKETFGKDLPIIGFYSNGEICPGNSSGLPLLHNETMTIATISEEVA